MSLPAIIFLIIQSFFLLAYLVYILVFLTGLGRLRKQKPNGDDVKPDISIVVAIRNEEQNLSALLESIRAQDYPRTNFELVIADDASDDGSIQRILEFQQLHPDLSINLLQLATDPKQPKKSALRYAVTKAKNDLIITTDGDCCMGPRWLSLMSAALNVEDVGIVSGPVSFTQQKGFFKRVQNLEFLSLVASGAGMMAMGFPIMANGANLAFRRKAFDLAQTGNALNRSVSGDDLQILFARNDQSGKSVFLYNREAIVETAPAENLKAFFSQRIRWASKARYYRNFHAVSLALLVFLMNLVYLLSPFLLIWEPRLFFCILLSFIIKGMGDLPVLINFTNFTRQQYLMKYFPATIFLYPPYIVISGMLGMLGVFKWKGRRFRS